MGFDKIIQWGIVCLILNTDWLFPDTHDDGQQDGGVALNIIDRVPE